MPKPLKIVLAVLIGLVVWFVAATVANVLLRASLPGYAEAELAARFPVAVKAFAVVLVLFFVPVHYALWARFPLWYHAIFLVSLAPLVLVGAWAARHSAGGVRGVA